MTRAEFKVALSFAGEDRAYVSQVADFLRKKQITVFYDEYERANLWGKDLYAHFDEVYRLKSEYAVIFVSRHSAGKMWPDHERRAAQARAIRENREYILPAYFDDTEAPGILETTGSIDLRTTTPQELADLIEEKLTTTRRPRTRQSMMSNADLDLRVRQIVAALRQTIKSCNDGMRELDNKYMDRARTMDWPGATEEEKQKEFREQSARIMEISQSLNETYSREFKSEMILLRDELISRTCPPDRPKHLEHMYEHGTNALCMEGLASDLERLAMSLPED